MPKQKKGFDELLVDLLIQDKAYYRFVGFDIFNDVTPLDGCYFFYFDTKIVFFHFQISKLSHFQIVFI